MLFAAGATILEWIVGKGFTVVALPAIILGVLHMGGTTLESRRNELRAQGAKICQQNWELHLAQQQASRQLSFDRYSHIDTLLIFCGSDSDFMHLGSPGNLPGGFFLRESIAES